jgi:hypothetical protein
MTGNAVVSVIAQPTSFTLTGGGAYCTGGAGVGIGLSGSQVGVSYQLMNGGTPVGTPIAGTGNPISFGQQTAAGSFYSVVATSSATTCTRNIIYSSVVITDPVNWYQDNDGDGFGNPAVSQLACTQPTGFVPNSQDCNDDQVNGETWEYLGSAGFSAGGTTMEDIATDNTGMVYVAYRDAANANKATVQKYQTGTWQLVGTAGMTSGAVSSLRLVIDNQNVPYLLTVESGNVAKVMKYDGTSWQPVGSNLVVEVSGVSYPSLAIAPNGTPYMIYKETVAPEGISVVKFDGVNWAPVGNTNLADPDFPGSVAYKPNIHIDANGVPYIIFQGINNSEPVAMKFNGSNWVKISNASSFGIGGVLTLLTDLHGTPFLSYQDWSAGQKASVAKYSGGTSWSYVGSPGFSTNSVLASPSFALNGAGIPYVGYYGDNAHGSKANVKRFDGTNWVSVGPPDFSPSVASYSNIAISKDGRMYITFQDGSLSNKASVMQLVPTIIAPDVPGVSTVNSNICSGNNATLSLSGNLNSASRWQWYEGSCGGTAIGTGTSINVSPTTTTTYYVRGEGCVAPGSCGTITLNVSSGPTFTSCPADVTMPASTGSCDATVSYGAVATGSPTPTLSFSFSGATTGSGSGTGTGALFNIGNTLVTIIATNSCGTSQCSFTVTVTDNQAPSIVCPANISVDADPGLCRSQVTVIPPVVTDNCTVIGRALNFTSSGDYVAIPHTAALNFGTGAFTVEAWIKASPTQPGFPTVISKRSSAQTNGFIFGLWFDGRLFMQLQGFNYPITGSYSLRDDQWHHIAASRTTGGQLTYFVDGVPTVMGTSGFNGYNLSTTHDLWLGWDEGATSTTAFNGTIDEVRIWNISRTAADINTTMNSQVSASSPGLTALYRFDQGIAGGNNAGINTATDYTGNGNTGTLTNFTLNGNSSNWVSGMGGTTNVVITNSFNNSADASGHYPVGTTSLLWTATDAAGNYTTCTQQITVNDVQPPVAQCKNYTLNLSGGTGTVTASDINNNSADNCAITLMSVAPSVFTCVQTGNQSATLTVKDAAGNTSTCTSVINVQGLVPVCNGITVTPANNINTGGIATNLYIGYGPQSATMSVNAPLPGSGFTYLWSGNTPAAAAMLNCTTCPNPVFTPTTGGLYTFTVRVTASSGCITLCQKTFCVKDIRVFNNNGQPTNKVYMTSIPQGNPANASTISVNLNTVPIQLSNGNQLGSVGQTCLAAPRVLAASSEITEVKVYPNPNRGTFYVEIPYTESVTEIRVTDIQGKLIGRTQMTPRDGLRSRIDIAHASSGVYFVEVINSEQSFRTRLIIN